MVRILHISSSPRGDRSQSLAVASAFLAAYAKANPDHVIQTLDLWDHPLPEISQDVLDAKHAALRGLTHTRAQAEAWDNIVREAQQLASYDKLLFSIPMWNWSIPFVLKQYIDVVTQPRLLFNWSAETGYVGLLRKPVAVIYTSSFDYTSGPMNSFDHQKPYFEHWLSVVGCTGVSTITFASTAVAPDILQEQKALVLKKTRLLAQWF